MVTGEGPLADSLRAHGVQVEVIPFRGWHPRSWTRVLRSQVRLSRLISEGSFDLVHAHLLKSIVVARVALWRRPRRPPLVSQFPGIVHLEMTPLRWIDRLTMRRDAVLVASCTAFASVYRAQGAPVVRVNHYGMHVEEFTKDVDETTFRQEVGLAPGALAVGMVAHMYPTKAAAFRDVGVKGHETFIDAALGLRDAWPDMRFFVVGDEFSGDGSYRAALEERAAALVQAGRMTFLGHRDDVKNVLEGMDVLVNPSLSESASYTMIEASLMEKAVIASDVGGLPDTVKHDLTGLLVPPADAPALANAIAELAGDEMRRSALGTAGRQHCLATFDIRHTVDVLEGIYAEVTSR